VGRSSEPAGLLARADVACDKSAVVAYETMAFGYRSKVSSWLSPSGWDSAKNGGEVLAGMTARQAFDHLMGLMPAYRWKEMDGVAVVRPQAAWDDPADMLTLPATSFTVTNGSLNTALHMALRAVTPFVSNPHEDFPRLCRTSDLPLSVEFRGCSMLDALNAVIRAHQGAEWELGYRENRATITVREFCASGGTGSTTLYFRTHADRFHEEPSPLIQ
jgi:hypothetical protein